VEALKENLRKNPKTLIGNRGYRKYLKLDRDHLCLDEEKIAEEEQFDGKWVLQTNTSFSPVQASHCFEWAEIKQDLKALQEIVIEEEGKSLVIRSECKGTCGKVFQSVGVAIPPTIREL
jgi:hypothetical protein